ncbi:hypothetical protein BCR42DRAFT_363366 [Absidia repens]|uniref:Uncharacterized protein n=1 Tax=Absidia repens TaxID=90262 RepID=A0A1X2J0D2_9FUNG|nr:hypothetical protein BCR42DRAFT_363366 [Absidia repens]
MSYLANGQNLGGVDMDVALSYLTLSPNGEHQDNHIPTEDESPSYLDTLNLRLRNLEHPEDILPYFLSYSNMSDLLVELNLSKNSLSDLPMEMNQLINLRQLNLACNQFTQLPDVLYTLVNLQHLDLSENQLVNLDQLPMALQHLRTLRAGGNRLERLDDRIDLWQNMVLLQLGSECGGNRLMDLPEGLAGMEQLEELDLSNNQLQDWPSYPLPRALKHLKMPGNQLKDIPHDLLLCCPNLISLDMASNRLAFLPFLNGFYGSTITPLQLLNVSNNNIYIVPTSILGTCAQVVLTGNPALEYHRKATTTYAQRLRDLSRIAIYSSPYNDFYMDVALIELLNYPSSSPLEIENEISLEQQDNLDSAATAPVLLFLSKDQHSSGIISSKHEGIFTDKGELWVPSLRELSMRYIADCRQRTSDGGNKDVPSTILDDLQLEMTCDMCGRSCVNEWLSAIQVKSHQIYSSVVCKVTLCSTACWLLHYQKTRLPSMPTTTTTAPLPQAMASAASLPPLHTLSPDSFEWIVAAATASAIQMEEDQALE